MAVVSVGNKAVPGDPLGDAQSDEVVSLRHVSKYSAKARTMTPEILQELCRQRGGYTKAVLNTQLILNHRGFDFITNLGEYTKVRLLHLDNNNIARIEGLEKLTELRSLYIGSNRLTKIEGLENNLQLRHLELESNSIADASGLTHLVKLEHLNLANNAFEEVEAFELLHGLTALAHLDVSGNKIEASDGVVEFWASILPRLRVFRYHGNPGARHIANYRKQLVSALPELTYLDDRPVFQLERQTSVAWAKGGQEALVQAKNDFNKARAAEIGVEPDRKEFLTRMRNLAIERIKQKEEEEKLRIAGIDVDALKASSDSPAKPSPAEGKKDPEKFAFAPPDRRSAKQEERPAEQEEDPRTASGAPGEEHASAPKSAAGDSKAPPPEDAQGEPPSEEPQGPTAAGGDREDDAEDVEDKLFDRQLAVMGEDPWAGTSMGTLPRELQSLRKPQNLRQKYLAQDKVPQETAMQSVPRLWEGREEISAREEERIMEMNMASAKMWRESPTPDPKETLPEEVVAGGNELAELD